MILNTTYTNKDNKEMIDELVGKSFSFWKRLRKNGIGSSRMIIEEVSPNMQQYLNTSSQLNYSSIELRPNGILVFMNQGLKNFTWAIPYYQLVVYKVESLSIHAQGRFVRFRKNRMLNSNKSFFKKLMLEKAAFNESNVYSD